jgi:hypothetical protein
MLVRAIAFGLVLAFTAAGHADEVADKVCPILQKAAAALDGKVAAAVQADLVLGIGQAWDFDFKALKTVTDTIDAATSAGCPEARAALLKHLDMESLKEALR